MDSYKYFKPAFRKGNLVWKDSVGGKFLGKGDVRQRFLVSEVHFTLCIVIAIFILLYYLPTFVPSV